MAANDATILCVRPRCSAFLGVFALFGACSPAPSPPPHPPAPPLPSVFAVPVAPPPDLPSPFHLAAINREEGKPFEMYALGSAMLIVEPLMGLIAKVEGDSVVWDPALLAGLPADFLNYEGTGSPWTFIDLAGIWPDPVWMVSFPGPDVRTADWKIHRWRGNRWVEQPRLLHVPIGRYGWIRPWGTKRFFIIYTEPGILDRPEVFQQIYGPTAVNMPRLPCFEGSTSVATLPSGEIFALATAVVPCRVAKAEPAVTGSALFAWAPEARDPRVFALPPGFSANRLLARSPVEVYVAGDEGEGRDAKPAVARFDGTSFSVMKLPGRGSAFNLASEPDGTLWATGLVSDAEHSPEPPVSGVWRRPPGDAWSSVSLPALAGATGPEHAYPGQVVVRGPGDVWISASSRVGNVLFHTHAPEHVFEVPDHETRWEAIHATGRRDLPLPFCNGLHVILAPTAPGAGGTGQLAAIGRTVKGSSDLRGVIFGEADLPEGRAIVATVPNTDVGNRMVRTIRAIGGDLAPKLVCRERLEPRPIKLP
jgi:hypothetical protein